MMLRNFYNSFSFEAQLTFKLAFMVFTAFFVVLSTKGMMNLFDVAYTSNQGSFNSVQSDVVVGDFFSYFSVFAFAAYGFFFSMRKL